MHFAHDTDQLIFGPIDLDEQQALPQQPHPFSWDDYTHIEPDVKPPYSFAALSHYDFGPPAQPAPFALYDDPAHQQPVLDELATWINDPDLSAMNSPSSPIHPIPTSPPPPPSSPSTTPPPSPPMPAFPPLPSPPSTPSPAPYRPPPPLRTPAPHDSEDMSLHTPSWAAHLWDAPSAHRTQTSITRPSIRHSPLTDVATLRQRIPARRGSIPSGQLFTSSSAPTHTDTLTPAMTRAYSRRADSVISTEDRDATVRRRKKSPEDDIPSPATSSKAADPPLKSVLRPPKLAPSAWQLYFTDWIQRQQASGTRKLNVAQAAKEAGQEYACLSAAEKEPYKHRSQAMKEAREREHEAYMRTLTPEDIKRENAFRAAQRKAGKSRKSNIKDPNAPKKPLSAYFMFLQRIRANPRLVAEIFGDETETTKQSVLAAAKWRSMTDAERQPFLAQAEQEKMEYEAARRLYEEGTTGFGSSINFSILPGSPHFPIIKMESESESEGFTTDDGFERSARS
ncbi:unnamed protein product [Cyclocybe aegerita]|uniref:HMG box domain-containing protein n=1 Tax=Cyclocybe aegerita TaxID=1973307 RepID=A0A8S0W2R9_CYCAE|nr:unnamed protein product [Cyclocybe aegerita]